ncbi:MAG TPA: MarP family serine protease [Solirubrobacteraceae bacterium]
MTRLDWFIVAFVALMALFGFRRGFIVGVLSVGGFALGAFLGTRLGPLLLGKGSASPYAPAFGLVGALVAGAILAGGLEGVGWRLRRTLIFPGLGVLDGALGALLSAAVGLAIVWIVAAVAAQTPGQTQLRADVQHSAILRGLNEVLPPSGPVLDALARLDPLPAIAGPSPNVAPPLPALARSPGARMASKSVVRVLGTACGLAIEGSGWVAAPNEIVTNAHVVAGEQDTSVEIGGRSPSLPAQAIAFDPTDDVAVLRVPELGLPALSLVPDPTSGQAGAILGYPENGPFEARAARIGETQKVLTQDAYGNGPVSRLLTPLRGVVRPGNSGGPLVDSGGGVLTTVFAGTTGSGPAGGYGVANATVAHVLTSAREPVGTGSCAG